MRSALFLHNTSPSSSWISPSKRYSSTSLRHIDFLIWLACLNGTNVSRTGQPMALLSVTYSRKRNWSPLNISAQRLFSFLVTSHYIKKFFLSLEVSPVHPFHQLTARGYIGVVFFLVEEFAFLYFCKCCYLPNLITEFD